MLNKGTADWLHLVMFSIIAILAGGWLIYYINVTAAEEEPPHYYLYKVVREEPRENMAISDPGSGYGRITVVGKITGINAMSAAISNYFQIDNDTFEKYKGKFVEATGYISQFESEENHWRPFKLTIESVKIGGRNDIIDTGQRCGSSNECRYQCVLSMNDLFDACPGAIKGDPSTFCNGLSGKCSEDNLAYNDCGQYWELNGNASQRAGSCLQN